MKMTTFFSFLKVFLGFGSIRDGSICRFSKGFVDFHDYPVSKGGDGIYPSPGFLYTCPRCGKRFSA